MTDTEQPQPERRLTPTERLHDVTMAAITRTQPQSAGKTPTIGMLTSGTRQGQWICKDLGGNPLDAPTPMAGWSQELELARQVQRDLIALNAEAIADEIAATLNKEKP